ncbi:ABC transporter ATP-binding protein [Paenochrobactrum sp. BZR 588]|uniref:ABC transporter ATP-binding protein n=1 Tax=Paenochrobactrum sp. BZR 588 TaxID=3378076 RepID=UPI003851DDEF
MNTIAPPHSETAVIDLSEVIAIKNLRTTIGRANVPIVDGINLSIKRGKTLGIVGESGCGKSMLSLSVMGLVPPICRIEGSINLTGQDLVGLSDGQMRRIRGKRIAMIFQEPMTSLNPVLTVGFQIVEAMRAHDSYSTAKSLRERAIRALEQVRMPAAERRFDEYPHQLSGGMRQRAAIAMALCCKPEVLIADEPTTALDVTVQAEILDLLRDLQAETQMAIILISHDLGVVAQMADEVAVMYAGRIVEHASCTSLFEDPQHPYTIGLLGSIPRMDIEEKELLSIDGNVPLLTSMPNGCRFHPRCVFSDIKCARERPVLQGINENHFVACIHSPIEETSK